MDKSKDLAFGCGHQTCNDCGKHLVRCPMCQQPITTRIRLYWLKTDPETFEANGFAATGRISMQNLLFIFLYVTLGHLVFLQKCNIFS
jgi:DTW domain-containing protein YfiP